MEEDITIRKIRIFVAGSKKLQAKRDFVKRIVSEYNTKKFDLYMKPFFFYVYDYTSFYPAQRLKGQQDELYNAFIDSHADLAFFLVDGEMGDKTEEEFNIAINAIKKDRRPPHPDIHVFGKKGINPHDVEIVKDYFIDYSSYDNLEKTIIGILDGYMDNIQLFYKSDSDKYNKSVSEREISFISFVLKINHVV